MPTIARTTLAVIAGLVASFVVVACVESLSHILYPAPEGVDLSDPEQLKAFVSTLPLGALLAVIVAWIAGAFVGGKVTRAIDTDRPSIACGTFGGLFLAVTAANLFLIPHPTWFAIVAVLSIIVVVVLVARVPKRPPVAHE